MAQAFQLPGISPLIELMILIFLLVIGLIIIIAIAKVIFFFLPAAIFGLVVWFLTQSPFLAGVVFLIVAFISLVKRK